MNTGAAIASFLAPGRINLGAHFGGVLGWEPLVGPTFVTVRPLNLVLGPTVTAIHRSVLDQEMLAVASIQVYQSKVATAEVAESPFIAVSRSSPVLALMQCQHS